MSLRRTGAASMTLGAGMLAALLLGSTAQADMTVDFGSIGTVVASQTLPMVYNPCNSNLPGLCHASPDARAPARRPASAQSFIAAATARPARPGAPQVPLRYVASPAVHQQVLADLVGRMRAKDPQAAQVIQSTFAKYDYAGLYDGIAGPYGLSGNDAGNAMTAYLILGWMIANGVQDVPGGRMTAIAARAQIADMLARNGAAPREKWAELGEELKLQFVIAHAGWLSSMKEGNARPYADGIARQFEQVYGIDLRRTTLDASGLHGAG
ncbi:hypothetical protein HZF05_08740 [Sphingomonas sp. CGMCC 1.13654]|uniref:Uncharacterized protein n=1 Tax=Sphingomonas chungangi TaxID=2683589 RepID=A0A838L7R6_9SPHN|nr:hypothetical protein [Sphingomonas chungangi]MBA2934186.1 hypothetical protein [Sphingomonas chungangi]MVW57227.1 hypothetical protein [Sphingomonas chungangi]